MTETIITILLLVPALIVAIVFHEVAHGRVALMLGDTTARDLGRLSLNPVRHVDPVGTLLVPGGLALAGLPVFGWAKPVPVIQSRLNNPRYGMMAVAAAGPATNLVLALLGAVLIGVAARLLPGAEASAIASGAEPSAVLLYLAMAMQYFIMINIFLALFNLLPIPPFDGSHIVEGLLPPSAAATYARIRPFGFPLLFGLLLVVPWLFPGLGLIEKVVLPPVEWVQQHFFAIAVWIANG